jgi:hypothetical protein
VSAQQQRPSWRSAATGAKALLQGDVSGRDRLAASPDRTSDARRSPRRIAESLLDKLAA